MIICTFQFSYKLYRFDTTFMKIPAIVTGPNQYSVRILFCDSVPVTIMAGVS